MPFGDQTGPMGQGPMTGRGRGYCAGGTTPGAMNPAPGLGRGRGGRGGQGGRGARNRVRAAALYAGQTPAALAPAPAGRPQEIADLKAAIGRMGATLGDIQKRLEGLDATPKSE